MPANTAEKKAYLKEYRAAHADARRESDRAYYAANREKILAASHVKTMRRYGITPEQFAEMLFLQGGVCAVAGCGRDGGKRRLHVDHDHATGEVRGLLCGQHNRALGLCKDDPEQLRSLAAYLEG